VAGTRIPDPLTPRPRLSFVLETRALTKAFGGLVAVHNFTMSVAEHELVGLIGPNGAGKTTVFNLITGMYVPTGGGNILQRKRHRRYQTAPHLPARSRADFPEHPAV